MRSITIVQSHSPLETSDIVETDAYYEQLLTAQVRFSKGGIVMVMGNLNAKVDFGDTSLRHLMGMHGLSDGKNNGERFVNFRNFH